MHLLYSILGNIIPAIVLLIFFYKGCSNDPMGYTVAISGTLWLILIVFEAHRYDRIQLKEREKK